MEQKIRLQKFLAECGIASRRKSEELIAAKHVKVNGRIAQIGDSIDPRKDKVFVKGKRVQSRPNEKRHIMLYKPRGYVSTMSDEMGRKSVADLVSNIPVRLFPVGRLDKDSEGLILMTNDGEFSNKITHPSNHIPKTYRVTVKNKITEDQLAELAAGVEIDGQRTMPAEVDEVLISAERSVFEITIFEGRNRQIRKMCEALDLEVARLKRIKIGQLKLGMLQPGKYRELDERDIKKIFTSNKKKIN